MTDLQDMETEFEILPNEKEGCQRKAGNIKIYFKNESQSVKYGQMMSG